MTHLQTVNRGRLSVVPNPIKGGAQMYFIGVDHHKQFSVMTVLDEQGKELRTERLQNTRFEGESFLREFGGEPFAAVVEAGRSSYVMADLLRELGGEGKKADPAQGKAIAHP